MINYDLNVVKRMQKNCINNDCERRLFNVHSLGIIWSSLLTPSSFILYFEQVYYEIFFSLKYLFDFFCISG